MHLPPCEVNAKSVVIGLSAIARHHSRSSDESSWRVARTVHLWQSMRFDMPDRPRLNRRGRLERQTAHQWHQTRLDTHERMMKT